MCMTTVKYTRHIQGVPKKVQRFKVEYLLIQDVHNEKLNFS